MNYPAGVILACLAMGVIVAMAYQAVSYTRGGQIISRRQFVLRMCNGGLLLAAIGMIFFTAVHKFHPGVPALVYWIVLTLLPVVVMILAWLDLRELRRVRHIKQAELYRYLAQLEHQLRSKPPGEQ